jgi:hypothetical protein
MKKKVASKKTQKFPTKAAKPVAKVAAKQPAQKSPQQVMPQGRPDMPLAATPQPQQMM